MNSALVVGDPRGILGQKLGPQLINLLIIIIINYLLNYITKIITILSESKNWSPLTMMVRLLWITSQISDSEQGFAEIPQIFGKLKINPKTL